MTLGEFWEEYHTAITLISGGALSLLLYKLPKPNTAFKVLIFVVALFFLTGLLGLIKFAVLVAAIIGFAYGGVFALWIYGVIALVLLKRAYGWELEGWQIFLITGIWFPISILLSMPLTILEMYVRAALVARKKPIADGNN